jgi:uncharacterized damage-inducible protein DinB
MPHPLVEQLRFARVEFQRGIAGINEVEAQERFLPMNCISWNVGHLAWHEQGHWLINEQRITLFPDIERAYAYGAPASTPALADVQSAWQAITAAADPWLDSLSDEQMLQPFTQHGRAGRFNLGSRFYRMIYHYWYHTGENAAIRQLLGHTDLPLYVGPVEDRAPYRLE